MPGFAFKLVDDMVEMRPKVQPQQLSLLGTRATNLPLSPDAIERGSELAPDWDIYGLEAEWRDWIAKKGIMSRAPGQHFVAFCKRRGMCPSFRR